MLKTVDLKNLLEETLNGIRIPNNIVTAPKVGSGIAVQVNPDLMKSVFANLAENAVQAMPSGGRFIVEAHRDERSFRVSFSDTGVGIPEDVKSKLFTPLFTTKSKGQGFGLAVCKRIVEAHKGEITYASEVGKGTVFTVKISTANNTPHP